MSAFTFFKHHIKDRTFCLKMRFLLMFVQFLTMQFFIDFFLILNDAIFYRCLKRSKTLAYGKIRVSPRIERARVICQRPRKNFGKERAFGARARHG